MFRWLRYLIIVVLLTALILFSIQNVQIIEVQFLGWSLVTPRALLVFVVFVAGAIAGWVFRGGRRDVD